MRLVITDRPAAEIPEREGQTVITDNGAISRCVGCFGCWVKTPGRCVINDEYSRMGELLGECDELFIISRCVYGCYSPFVKNVIDRTLSYMSPYFCLRDGETHHQRRYKNIISMTVCFYGDNITEGERETARELVQANALNFDAVVEDVLFFDNPINAGGCLE